MSHKDGPTTLTRILTPLASLRIAVTLMVFSLLLIFAGTTAQKDFGSWDVQRDYFYSWGVMAPLKYFFPLTKWSETLGGQVPLPGGYPIAIAMLINLAAAHILRFKITWRDLLVTPPLVALVWGAGVLTSEYGYYVLSAVLIAASVPLIAATYWLHGKRGGVILIHLGIILMLGGELATNVVKIEQTMAITEGGYANYASDIRYGELAIVDSSDASKNQVITINESRLKPGKTVTHARLPFSVHVDAYYHNSDLVDLAQRPETVPQATAGAGLRHSVVPMPKSAGASGDSKADYPAAVVTLSAGGKELGRYLVSQQLNPQPVEVNGKTYELSLRWPRYYKDFEIHLKDFRFDRHTGTQMARNFSSDVRIVDPGRNEDREVRIWMNHPLRYRGETFYQQTFDPRTETTTYLQVVRNPSWLFPYIACVVGGLGMLAHFGMNLAEFSRKRSKAAAAAAQAAMQNDNGNGNAGKAGKQPKDQYVLAPRYGAAYTVVPVVVLVICLAYLGREMAPKSVKSPEGLDLRAASAIPMNFEGRVMPLDTLARVSLKVITGGKEELDRVVDKKDDETKEVKPVPPGMQFLLDTLTRNERARQYKIFKIDNPEVVSLMELEAVNKKDGKERQYFSWEEMEPNLENLRDQVVKLADVDPKKQTAFQRELGELWKQVKAFDSLAALTTLHLLPPASPGGEWREPRALLAQERGGGGTDESLDKLRAVLGAYSSKDANGFNEAVAAYRAHVASITPKEARKARVEVFFNRVAPFYHLMGFYVLAFVLVLLSFMVAPLPLRRAVWWVLILTIVVHTVGLIVRMYLQGRPPVTTLYSSAIFIGWGGVLMALGLERFFKNGVGLLVASVVGGLSLFLAHNLAMTDGDTLKELQAVLDTNFWLATHVVMITLGYAATFLAGALAITYVLRGLFTATLDKPAGKDLTRMVYGIVCFAMLFSFVGTVLGGIWADQSWGRFWGWDPKENGAILIVLWNALILHARWGGLIRDRGIMLLAIFGNVVTSWSYFGTNELGVGLHAYGDKEGRAFWLALFVASQMFLIALGSIPQSLWRSGRLLREAPVR